MSKGKIVAAAAAAAIAIAAPVVAYFEGYIPTTYADPVGIPTICFGHTGKDVTPGRKASRAECEEILRHDLNSAVASVYRCIGVPMEPHQLAAMTSFVFNVGEGALCRSTLARKANYGDWIGACAELSKWTKATKLGVKVELPGLVKRRALERKMCEGIT